MNLAKGADSSKDLLTRKIRFLDARVFNARPSSYPPFF